MERTLIGVLAMFIFIAVSGCASHKTAFQNVAKGTAINAAAGVPFAGFISLGANAIDLIGSLISGIGKPKVGKTSKDLSNIVMRTPMVVSWDEKGNPKWGKYAAWRENGETKRIKSDQVPQEKLNYKAAWTKAISYIPGGIFSDNDKESQKLNQESWEKAELVVAEYTGLNGAKVVAVSNHNEPFEIMLPEEWEARKVEMARQKAAPPEQSETKTQIELKAEETVSATNR